MRTGSGDCAAREPVSPSEDAISGSVAVTVPAPDAYDMFTAVVALRQLAQWLPLTRSTVLDVSLPLADAATAVDHRISDVVRSAGHQVITVTRDAHATGMRRPHPVVVGDPRRLTWVRSHSVDVVLAEGGAVSEWLGAEDALRDVARVLRPGGQLLATADSMVLGLARLAQQHRWSELADAPAADVVLVPDPLHDGALTRYFGPEDLSELLNGAGLEVDWIRPRTVLPAGAVRQTLDADPAALHDLVMTELRLAQSHEGEPHGNRLVVSGRKPR